MDESERGDRNREPNWVGKARPMVSRRPVLARYEEPSEPTSWLFNLVLLIVLCVVLMAIATAGLRQWRPSPVASGVVEVTPNPERAAARSLLNASEELEKQARTKTQQEADLRREAAIKQREAEEEAARQTAAREARREREWQAYYKKPAYCDESRADIDSIGCANDYIRARREFDARFGAARR
jgi:hypothetical protein